jgi:tellurite resistance protein TerC
LDTRWIVFGALLVGLLAFDLGMHRRRGEELSQREAIWWSVFWVSIGIAFSGFVFLTRGATSGWEYLGAFVVEKALSVDNLFVMSVVFTTFGIPKHHQHNVLFWGILGALITRGLFVALGVELIHAFWWTQPAMGLFLLYTSFKLLTTDESEADPSENAIAKLAERSGRFDNALHEGHFFTKIDGRWMGTRLLLTLLVIEATDVAFAVDSIPAVLGFSNDLFVVYTSNVFAVLGLRALYSVLADVVVRFHYMSVALAAILAFVGAKMVFIEVWHVPPTLSLAVILSLLVAAAVASWARERQAEPARAQWRSSLEESRTYPGASDDAPTRSLAPVERLMHLNRVPMFQRLSLDDLRDVVDDLHLLHLRAGETVIEQGEVGDTFYVVVEGRVGVYVHRDEAPVQVAVLGPDDAFGEMALFEDNTRTATVKTLTDATLIALARDAFHRLGMRRPTVLLEVIRVMAGRLAKADAAISKAD